MDFKDATHELEDELGDFDLEVDEGISELATGEEGSLREASSDSWTAGDSRIAAYRGRERVIRLVHISDTHNKLVDRHSFPCPLPAGDILVHSGDFAQRGSEREYVAFNSFLESVADMYQYRVVVLGNHDIIRRKEFDYMKALLPAATHVLCHETCEILGIKIHGMPWISRVTQTSQVIAAYRAIPDDLDVLISHIPPLNVHDICAINGANAGSVELIKTMVRRVNPAVHLFGHVHEESGCTLLPCWKHALKFPPKVPRYLKETVWFSKPQGSRGDSYEDMRYVLAVNSSICDQFGIELFFPPQVIEFRRREEIDGLLEVRVVR